jgi:DDE superfamily endonuclease
LIIFRGEPPAKGGSIFSKEKDRYHPGVIVNFNEKAWNNGALFMEWITKEPIPIMKPTEIDPVLLAMDCVSFHKTPEVTPKANHVQVVMVPPGCTGILQPLPMSISLLRRF